MPSDMRRRAIFKSLLAESIRNRINFVKKLKIFLKKQKLRS